MSRTSAIRIMIGPAGMGVMLAGLATFCASLSAQVQKPERFEVASVKRSNLPGGDSTLHLNRDGVSCNCSLGILIENAYSLDHYALVGPDWITWGPDRFEVRAQSPAGASQNQILSMLRQLLLDRFHLAAHYEPRETEVYELVVAADGLKVKPAPTIADGSVAEVLPFFGWGRFYWDGTATMPRVATILSGFMERPVVDRTGIAGVFQIRLDARVPPPPSASRPVIAVENPTAEIDGPLKDITVPFSGGKKISGDAPSIFLEIQKLGLKLVPARIPVPHLVVDAADRTPTDN